MKIVVYVVSVVFILMGAVWIAQGLNIVPADNPLHRSFMVGQPIWAAIGLLAVIGGLYGLNFARTFRARRRR